MAHGDRSVDVFIRKVRQKLEKASPDWSYIHTHFGVGYRFDPEPQEGAERPAPAEVRPPVEEEPSALDGDAVVEDFPDGPVEAGLEDEAELLSN
jgi:DNA-binding winged helix-turn-helix (wHTH) protein